MKSNSKARSPSKSKLKSKSKADGHRTKGKSKRRKKRKSTQSLSKKKTTKRRQQKKKENEAPINLCNSSSEAEVTESLNDKPFAVKQANSSKYSLPYSNIGKIMPLSSKHESLAEEKFSNKFTIYKRNMEEKYDLLIFDDVAATHKSRQLLKHAQDQNLMIVNSTWLEVAIDDHTTLPKETIAKRHEVEKGPPDV